METKQRLLVFSSGSGSGFQTLVENSRTGILQAKIVGLVSDKKENSCLKRAIDLGIFFTLSMESFTADDYQKLVREYHANYVALSGWLKQVKGLDPRTTINIRPGPLPEFGGKGMYGHRVHEAVIQARKKGKIKNSEVCMHFVTEEYDQGPVFFRYPVHIYRDDTAETLAVRVNKIEHAWQSYITNLVVTGKIYWDGNDPKSLHVPSYVPL